MSPSYAYAVDAMPSVTKKAGVTRHTHIDRDLPRTRAFSEVRERDDEVP